LHATDYMTTTRREISENAAATHRQRRDHRPRWSADRQGLYSAVTWYTGVQGHGIQFYDKIKADKTQSKEVF